ncbi:MAG: anthranilate phosphoribosyltransferase [Planctomycetota bacterium]
MIDDAISTLEADGTLDEALSYGAFAQIMTGGAEEARITRLLSLLARRPVTVDELTGAARVMREHVEPVPVAQDVRDTIIDTCGTGGAPKAFNVSTVAALIAAGAGRRTGRPVRVAKHGNRSRTGRGSAEVLIELGVNAEASPAVQARCLEEAGVCFCFAIHHHPAIRHAMPSRRALDHPTIYNLLGPMTNPAGSRRQLIGCFDAGALGTMTRALERLGAERAMVCRGDDGLDEITTTTTTTAFVLDGDGVRKETIDASAMGVPRATLADLQVADVAESARVVRGILEGDTGARTDIAIVNAGAALVVGGAVGDLGAGVELAREAVRSGRALMALDELARVSRSA